MAKSAPMTFVGDPPAARGTPARPSGEPRGEPRGPYRASLVREGDHIEVSKGYGILTMAGGGSHAAGSLYGGAIVDSDPATPGAGVDIGFSTDPYNLRAPDVAVTPHTDVDGWITE